MFEGTIECTSNHRHIEIYVIPHSLQIKYGETWAPARGKKYFDADFTLTEGENIIKVTGHVWAHNGVSPHANFDGLPMTVEFHTSKGKIHGPYGHYKNNDAYWGSQFVAEGSRLVAISGMEYKRKYPYLSQLMFIFENK